VPQAHRQPERLAHRVGDYRVVYEIADAIGVVCVNRVRHRREVYR
jgi:mRNA-degrading endonuclease RelE of RelBE toxin-antitoxin system